MCYGVGGNCSWGHHVELLSAGPPRSSTLLTSRELLSRATSRGPGLLFCQHLYPKELTHFVCVCVIRGDAGVEGNAKQRPSLVV